MNLTETISVFFKHELTIKMYHFQTKLYGAHKASDKYLEKLRANIDRFMEVAQGKHGSIEATELNLKIVTVRDDNVNSHIDSFIGKLKNDNIKWDTLPELAVVRDEMLADAYQLKYLLQFK